MSVNLLKFDADGEKPIFQQAGLDSLRNLSGPICPVAFVGEGRSGKSFLANKLAGQEAFQTDDSSEAVTEGIDVFTLPLPAEEGGGHLMILDCEGGNNALAKTRAIVNVVAAVVATALVFVADGKASESALEALGVTLRERSAIKVDGTGSLNVQTLFFVVNQNRLRYKEDALNQILATKTDEAGTDLREAINAAYPEERRHFFTVPLDHKPGFEENIGDLHKVLKASAQPVKLGALIMNGEQLAQTLTRIECEIGLNDCVSLSSLHRRVIMDSVLKPTVALLLKEGLDKIGDKVTKYERARVSSVQGDCQECKAKGVNGWKDPDISEFFCQECWRSFSPKVLKCGFCSGFFPWPKGRVEKVSEMWHCVDCLMKLDINIPEYEGPE